MVCNDYFLTELYRLPGIHECFLLQVHLPCHWHLWANSTSRHCQKVQRATWYWFILQMLHSKSNTQINQCHFKLHQNTSECQLWFFSHWRHFSQWHITNRKNYRAPVEAICSQLTSHQLKDLSLLVQVAPPASQIGRQEATAWQVGWLWQHSYQSMAFQETQA